MHNDVFLESPTEIANACNNYFQSNFSPQSDSSSLDSDLSNCSCHSHIDALSFFEISCSDVLQEINCLKTSKPPGPDGILPNFLKFGGISVAPVLTQNFQYQFKSR